MTPAACAAARPSQICLLTSISFRSGSGPCLALKASDPVAIRRKARRQRLDGDVALQAGIVRAVDLAHPPAADQRHNLKIAKLVAGLERGRAFGNGRQRRTVEERVAGFTRLQQ